MLQNTQEIPNLMAVFYKIRIVHSIMNKGSISINGVVGSLVFIFVFYFPKQNSASLPGNFIKISLEMGRN